MGRDSLCAGGVGGLLAMVDSELDKSFAYLYNGNGDVGQLVDVGDGSVAAAYRYDPYGNLIASSGSLADVNPFRFSTKYFDQETNLYYYGYRYYLPELGRWNRKDPIGERGGRNLYNFVRNQPITSIDFLGFVVVFLTGAGENSLHTAGHQAGLNPDKYFGLFSKIYGFR